MNFFKSLVLMLAIALGYLVPAQASPMQATYSGLAYGTDGAGLFGTAGTVYWGAPFSGVVTFDPSLGKDISTPFSYHITIGGNSPSLGSPAPSPIQSVSLVLAGQTVNLDTSYLSQVQIGDPSDRIISAAVWGSAPENWFFTIHGVGGPPPTDPSGAYDIVVPISYISYGATNLGFNAPIVHIAPAAIAVPEPMTIAIFCVGLMGLGLMQSSGRGRRRKLTIRYVVLPHPTSIGEFKPPQK